MRGLLWLLILSLLLAPVAWAQDDGADDAKPDDDKADDARGDDRRDEGEGKARDAKDDDAADDDGWKHVVETTPGRALIKMEREVAGSEDEIKIDFNAEEGWLKVEHREENATMEADTELKVKLREVVEFEDLDGDGAYTPRADRLVHSYDVEQLAWEVGAPEDVTSANGVPGQRIVGAGAFPEGGYLGVVLYSYGGFADVNGTSLKPTEVKIDLLLVDFPYRENGTQPALVLKTEQETEAKLERESGSDDVRGLVAEAAGYAAYFTWADVALVDGVERPVASAVLESESENDGEESKAEQKISLAYPRGDDINHDPVMGIASADVTPTQATPGFALVVAVAAVALAAVAVARRRL